jgi:hypothetical protein
MSAEPAVSQPLPRKQSASTRIEYLGCQSATDYREYRLAFHTPETAAEVRFRIATAAFAARRLLLQDGPDVCYQRLQQMLAAGETPSPEITIEEVELAAYKQAHTPTPRRSVTPPSPPKRTPMQPRRPVETRPKLPVATPAQVAVDEPAFDEGQRVSHAVYGVGVTMASAGGHTSVQFDEHGVKRFVTSLLELEPLSAPNEWVSGPRGKNRRREQGPHAR